MAGSDCSRTPYHWAGDDLILSIVVQPRASRNAFVGIHGACVKVQLTAPPVSGKANQSLIKFVAKTFGVAPSRVSLLRGQTARTKTLRIQRPAKLPDFIKSA